MKIRKNRGVSQGTSNYKTFIVTNPSLAKINQTFAIKNSHKRQPQHYGKSHIHFNEIIQQPKTKNKAFDNLFPQPKIFNDPSYFLPKKSKVQQILFTLKNACQYKQYQYFKVFNFFDQKKNGKIDKQNVKKLVKCFGYQIDQNQANLLVGYMNGSKNQKQIHQYKSSEGDKKQMEEDYFTIQNFVQKIGNYAESDLKITGDPLLIKKNPQKQKKTINRTTRRNQSISVKKLLVDPFFQEEPERTKYKQSTLKTDDILIQKQKRRSPKARFSRFKETDEFHPQRKQQPHVKRIQSANPLIPRSSLPQQYFFNRESDASLTFKKQNNNLTEHTGDKFIEDQDKQRVEAKYRYQNKLKRIIDNNQHIINRCKRQNELTFKRQKFTQSWGMLSCSNGWVRS